MRKPRALPLGLHTKTVLSQSEKKACRIVSAGLNTLRVEVWSGLKTEARPELDDPGLTCAREFTKICVSDVQVNTRRRGAALGC